MNENRVIDFWFSVGSTYTYLSMMRAPALAATHGVRFNLRPFLLAQIFNDLGVWPFADGSPKTRYMWRDIERRAAVYGLSPRLPAPYPLKNAGLANTIAHLGAREGWAETFVMASYRRWMEQGQPTGDEPNLSASLRDAGQDPEAIVTHANAPETAERMQAETDEARRLGLFGSPSFVVAGEIFWGDDRLEDAIRHLDAL